MEVKRQDLRRRPRAARSVRRAVATFLRMEAASGIALAIAAAVAIVIANTPGGPMVAALFATQLPFSVAGVGGSLLFWVNDALMAVFFLLVGLELKREVLEGELSHPGQVLWPTAAALGGMVMPALFYVALNYGDAHALRGWAIPSATDIAFSLGILAALGSRVPLGLKLFLTTLAVVDDLGAIAIIAFFYTRHLSPEAVGLAAGCAALLLGLNRLRVRPLAPYLVVGIALWLCVLKSGVHPTVAGVVLALFIPRRARGRDIEEGPLRYLERTLHPWVAFGILPLFAFANAGLSLEGVSWTRLFEPVTIGIAGGLFLGKLVGVFGVSSILMLSGLVRMPAGGNWAKLLGVSICAGIGFTMSLFIGTLAFAEPAYAAPLRLGVVSGSLLSATVGFIVLRVASRRGAPRRE